MATEVLYVADDYVADGYFQVSMEVIWGTKVIFVPILYMTVVQTSPTFIYELDLDQFRLDLRALEASEEGQVFDDTHRHNTTVTLGGIDYARLVEIINGYTVTFEDGQYAVNLQGANSNVGDVVNVNQVSVRSANSAGNISQALILERITELWQERGLDTSAPTTYTKSSTSNNTFVLNHTGDPESSVTTTRL
tara:strand:+ start:2849 stop:3427 length:579 start_codon:yes stop_codon:yes gene_type:complete